LHSNVFRVLKIGTNISEELAESIFLPLTLKREAPKSSETKVPVCQTIEHHIPDGIILMYIVVRTSNLTRCSLFENEFYFTTR
jgi:hypothetical protein